MLSSLLLPNAVSSEEDGNSNIVSADARLTVMGIIIFIPYFNWLIWVFAWLDTGKRRYAVSSLVYLAPYLRSNMSLSPEESWLPIASILLGIIHVQDRQEHQNLPSAEDHLRNEIEQQGFSRKPAKHLEHSNGYQDDDDERKKP